MLFMLYNADKDELYSRALVVLPNFSLVDLKSRHKSKREPFECVD